MVVRDSFDGTIWDGWYRRESGDRLIRLPAGVRRIWLATGRQLGCHRLTVRQDSGDVTVLDMENYLKMMSVGVAWRNGGIRYVTNYAEVSGAHTLAAESTSGI
jgi:hypothetical protein